MSLMQRLGVAISDDGISWTPPSRRFKEDLNQKGDKITCTLTCTCAKVLTRDVIGDGSPSNAFRILRKEMAAHKCGE